VGKRERKALHPAVSCVSVVSYSTVRHITLQYCTLLRSTYCTVRHCAVQHTTLGHMFPEPYGQICVFAYPSLPWFNE
jgi:hypothetical protein